MKHKILATILAVSLLLSVFSGVALAAESNYPELIPEEVAQVHIETAGQIVYYQFTPEHSCIYTFYSVSEEDTYGSLYSQTGTLLYENDDFYGLNFGIECILQAGQTYILAVSFLDTAATGGFALVTHTNHDAVGEMIQEANCDQGGIWRYCCDLCGYEWTEVLPEAHMYENGICTACGDSMTMDGMCGDALFWNYNGADKTLTITGTGAMYDYDEETAPWLANECPVETVALHSGVTYIGNNAFANSEELKTVILADSVTGIGAYAFAYCTELAVLQIPEGVEAIGNLAFAYCGQLTEVTLPSSLTELGYGALQGCERLAHIRVDDNNPVYSSDASGVLFDKTKTMLIQAPAMLGSTYVIPETVSVICESAFSGCNRLAAVTIPTGVTEICSGAFANCAELTYLRIPGTVAVIGEGAISSCPKLKAIAFDADAPTADGIALEDIHAIAYYPADNATWTEENQSSLGEAVQWQAVSGLKILAQPEASESVLGSRVILSVGAYGDGLSYSWWMTQPESDIFVDTNVTDSVFETVLSSENVGRRIYCEVTDSTGAVVYSNIVTLNAMYILQDDIAVSIPSGTSEQFQYFAYTPAYNCYYTFQSFGALDTYCELYDSDYNRLYSADDAEDGNFRLRVHLNAGETYILGVCILSEETGGAEISVKMDHEYVRARFLPTCTNEGYTLHSCTVCGASYRDNVVPATGHSYQSVTIEPTCTQDGYTRYSCTSCGHSYQDDIVPANGHDWLDATCTSPKTCATCGYAEGKASGHHYEAVVHAPECLKDGYTAYTCRGCGHTYYDNYVTATGHDWQAADCQGPKTCSRCGATNGRPTEHTYESTVTLPGCQTKGYTTHSCTVCGHSFVDSYVNPTGHSWVDATCIDPMRCAACGETVGEPLEHYYVEGICVDCGDADPAYGRVNITLQYPTLLLEDEIKMNVFFTLDQDIPLENMGMLTWTAKPDVVDISTADAVIPGGTFDSDLGFYGVATEGIPAQNLGDVIYFCIYVELADGSIVYGKQVHYSPTQYAYNQLNGDADAETKALYVAILNYGAAAQVFLNDSDPLINANLTAQQKALVEAFRSDMVHSVAKPDNAKQGALAGNGGFSKLSPTISLDSAFAINYYFTPSATVKGNMTFYYWNVADFAAADVLSIDNATASMVMTNENGVYGAAIEGIAAKDIDGALYACGVYTDDAGNTYSTGILPYSLGFYCGNTAKGSGDQADLAAAIAVYGYYAIPYFA